MVASPPVVERDQQRRGLRRYRTRHALYTAAGKKPPIIGVATVELSKREQQALSYYRERKRQIEDWEDSLSDMEYAVYRILPLRTRTRLLRRVLADQEVIDIFSGWFAREATSPQYESALIFV